MGVSEVTKRGELATGSVAWNVVQFFRANPDEELLTEDIRVKWASPTSRVPQLLDKAVNAGLVGVEEQPRRPNCGGGVQLVYFAGHALRGMNE